MFKKDFLGGSASAAYQVEGGWKQDGKGLSIGDEYVRIPGKTYNNTNGDIATDHYNRYKEDIKTMKEMGLQTYRFSIAGARIFPDNTGKVNEKGIKFYDNLINELLSNNIEPMITLYHGDLPKGCQDDYDGGINPKVVEDFTKYAKVCFERFASKVKYGITMNEPNVFVGLGYITNLHPPGFKNDWEKEFKAQHYSTLAHAKAVLIFKDELKLKGMIGASIAYGPNYPASNSSKDIQAAKYANALAGNGFDPYYKGEYNKVAKEIRKSKNQFICEGPKEEMNILKKAAKLCDFIGINYYQSGQVEANPIEDNFVGGSKKMNNDGKKNQSKEWGIPGYFKTKRNDKLEYTFGDGAIHPEGILLGMKLLKERYNLPILISENGLGDFDHVIRKDGNVVIKDNNRIKYIQDHIREISKAVDQGIEVIAYCTGSYTDLLSGLNGYQKQYGFVYIDRENNLQRVKKESYHGYKEVIATNGKIAEKDIVKEYVGRDKEGKICE